MSVRVKLFLLLLVLSVLPVLVLRISAQFTFQELSQDLVQRSWHRTIVKTKDFMRLMVEDHAELWRREGLLLEQTMRLQASEVERTLAGQGREELSHAYASSARDVSDKLFGQITVFEDGQVVASSEDVRLPRRFDARQTVWYRLAVKEGGMIWTAPVIDPTTRRVGLTLSIPIRDASGRILGVTALMAPVEIGGLSNEHTQSLSANLKTYLVQFDSNDTSEQGLHIIGEPGCEKGEKDDAKHGVSHAMGAGRGMLGLAAPGWLTPDDPAERELILSDLNNGLSEVRQVRVNNTDWLWAYAPTKLKGTALILAAPKTDITADATMASEYIEGRFQRQRHLTFIILVAGLLVVTLTAWLVSRSFTKPITDLSKATAKLGEGDFEVRVVPEGGRELKELGRVFNEMGPKLKDHTRLTSAMALAQEVHHRLLPAHWPDLPGLDLSAVSISCEEVGGDFFDVIPGAHGHSERTAVLVGDVSGHGLDAALLMATARAFLRMRAHQPGSPAEVVTSVNRYLTMDTVGSGRFMTLFYLEIDPVADCMRWVRAGHDPAILYNQALDGFEDIGGPGIPLGVIEDRVFLDASRPFLLPGDVLLIGSDGLWEARSPQGDMFGKDRVRAILRQNASAHSKDILDALMAAFKEFKNGSPLEDDVTLMVIKSASLEVS
ncbi:MAG: SpoIIE family protein phosphatase [Desulfovibrio sp.]|nr:SpoIIE family protein phosphatase [Desulfovibrio sp.]MBI4958490.1 SpoIIE family protein phosphatase [Desulfovibrio sp.]